ncbi:putative cognition protein, partial [Trypoxylus dichotomus]
CVNIRNTESRAAYLNIAAGTMGVVGAGTTRIVSTLVRNGANIGTGVQYGITAINSANILISGTATINSCSDVIQQYIDDSVVPSALTIAQLGSSLFFFGNSLYHFQTGQTMVQEMQATKLNEISEGLRSNRHRKTFNKMLKETVRIKGEVRGKAEVIASMRNSASRDEVLAVLTRSNRYFNREGIRFSAERGSISLNGVSVDILEYGNMPKTQQSFTLESLPPIPESSSSRYVNNTRSSVQNMRYNERISNLLGIVPFDIGAATRTLTCFTQDIQPKILRICEDFMNQIDVDVIGNLKTLFKEDVRIKIIQYVTDFIRRYVDEIKEIFEKRLLNEEVTTVCQEFGFQNPHVTVYNFIEYIVNQFKNGNMMENLLSEFGKWYISLIYNKELKEERKRKRQETTNERKSCSSCGGYYYEQK